MIFGPLIKNQKEMKQNKLILDEGEVANKAIALHAIAIIISLITFIINRPTGNIFDLFFKFAGSLTTIYFLSWLISILVFQIVDKSKKKIYFGIILIFIALSALYGAI